MDAMDGWMICLCGEVEEEEERTGLPPTLSEAMLAAMQAPQETLDVPLKAPPSLRRDALRRNCVRLLALRELWVEAGLCAALGATDQPDLPEGSLRKRRPPAPHAAAWVAYSLLEAVGRRRVERLVRRLPRLVAEGYFAGSPREMVHTLRCAAAPRSRACAMLLCVCVGARSAESGWIFEFEIDYCARHSVVQLTEAGGGLGRLAAGLADAGKSKLAALVAKLAAGEGPTTAGPRFGRLMARAVTQAHAALAATRAFSKALLDALGLDVDRVWREEEPRIAALLDPPAARRNEDVAYTIDAAWLQAWRAWVTWRPSEAGAYPSPPGPSSAGAVLVSASLWAYFEAVHGKRGDRMARHRGNAEKSLPARPVALGILQRAWRRRLRSRPISDRTTPPSDFDNLRRAPATNCLAKADACQGTQPDDSNELELVVRPTVSPLHAATREEHSV